MDRAPRSRAQRQQVRFIAPSTCPLGSVMILRIVGAAVRILGLISSAESGGPPERRRSAADDQSLRAEPNAFASHCRPPMTHLDHRRVAAAPGSISSATCTAAGLRAWTPVPRRLGRPGRPVADRRRD